MKSLAWVLMRVPDRDVLAAVAICIHATTAEPVLGNRPGFILLDLQPKVPVSLVALVVYFAFSHVLSALAEMPKSSPITLFSGRPSQPP